VWWPLWLGGAGVAMLCVLVLALALQRANNSEDSEESSPRLEQAKKEPEEKVVSRPPKKEQPNNGAVQPPPQQQQQQPPNNGGGQPPQQQPPQQQPQPQQQLPPLDNDDIQPAIDQAKSLLEAARLAVQNNRIAQSKVMGFNLVKFKYVDLPPQGGVLIGFDFGLGKFTKEDLIYAMRPIFLTSKGMIAGEEQGLFRDVQVGGRLFKSKVERTVRVLAKPGYAVGGIWMRTGLFFDGMAMRYMKINGRVLNPRDAYDSDWVGNTKGGSPTTLSGGGAPILGVQGGKDEEHLLSMGVLCMSRL